MPFSLPKPSFWKRPSSSRSPQTASDNARANPKDDARANPKFAKLQADGTYPCPICRHGTVTAMPMMEESFSCDFCRHIFSTNLEEQVLRVEDCAQPLRWHWRGKTWRPARYTKKSITPTLLATSAAIAIFPPSLIGASQYLFPPLPGSRSLLPVTPELWLVASILVHGAIASWIVLEHYQFSKYISLKVRGQDWIEKLFSP
ncbi:MAG: hypothetical protein AAF889_14315 [Cyanobacteria bacterium P01_D01_bin.73]